MILPSHTLNSRLPALAGHHPQSESNRPERGISRSGLTPPPLLPSNISQSGAHPKYRRPSVHVLPSHRINAPCTLPRSPLPALASTSQYHRPATAWYPRGNNPHRNRIIHCMHRENAHASNSHTWCPLFESSSRVSSPPRAQAHEAALLFLVSRSGLSPLVSNANATRPIRIGCFSFCRCIDQITSIQIQLHFTHFTYAGWVLIFTSRKQLTTKTSLLTEQML